ncbi:tetratricopeptide repeat protein [Cryomorphaceae bacterium 1068]|nr:tetratricopeptide repeat protein [Cryomorphaceae bacterium 1068]
MLKRKTYHLFVALLFLSNYSIGLDSDSISSTDSPRDSLRNLIAIETDARTKSVLYLKLANTYKANNSEDGIAPARRGVELARKADYPIGIAENYAVLGDLFVSMNQLDSARVSYQEAGSVYKDLGRWFDCAQVTMIIGNILLAQNKYVEAQKTYLEALEIAEKQSLSLIEAHLNNNLGVLYMDIEDYDDAKNYSQKAIQGFIKEGDLINANLARANVYQILVTEGEYDKAIDGFLDIVNFFLKEKNWEHVAYGYNEVASIHYERKDYLDAEEFAGLALTTVEKNLDYFEGPSSYYRAEIYTTLAKIFNSQGKESDAMKFARAGYSISVQNSYSKNAYECAEILFNILSLSVRKDSALYYGKAYIESYKTFERDRDVKQITQLKMQREFDEAERKREVAIVKKQAAADRRELIYIGALIITLLLVTVLVFRYKNQKIKTDRANLLRDKLELEKESLGQKLRYKNKELATNMMYLLEKNEFIGSITNKLIDMRSRAKKENQDFVQEIIIELKRNSSQKIWEEFEMRFKEVHADFYQSLMDKYPDLTPNEVRLSAFLRLNMSTKEISAITHQSVKSINMARFRLRKKIGIDRDENLISFLTQL